MIYLYMYLLSCVVVYIYLVCVNPISYKDVSKMDILRGILGTLIYPITLAIMYWILDSEDE